VVGGTSAWATEQYGASAHQMEYIETKRALVMQLSEGVGSAIVSPL